MILAGDIGGTKTHLALFEEGGSARRPRLDRKLPSREFPSLIEAARSFLRDAPEPPTRAVFGIAGPVVDNRCEATNLPWHVDGDKVGAALGGIEVALMNDLETTAHGLELLGPRDLETLNPGTARPGNRALIAAGTGLGEAFLLGGGRRWRPSASEGGHSDFAPRNPLEDELNLWLRAKHGRVSYERILSGRGLAEVYRFLAATRRGDEPEAFARAFAGAEDPAAMVTAAALDGSCERARLAAETFLGVYGAEAGNLALKFFAVGGVFVGGGIAPKMLPLMRDGGFARAFCDKGRLSALVRDIPMSVVLDAQTALWGAAAVALATPAHKEPA
ncbi:MAG: glucokinase [Candidatus Eisenbacteria bacterium RBG_16_71_46]|nr:MAG: glucokinase [Candidatus Eisenbacteria bacterium RBG_16_71_46]